MLLKHSQKNSESEIKVQESSRFVFYNVENLFDIYDDPKINDNEFLPQGVRNWTEKKFHTKINNIYKTLIATGEWNMPDVIGLCEIENYLVLEQLLTLTPLNNFNYEIIHNESPDHRGVDVALLYNPKIVKSLFSRPLRIEFPFVNRSATRDILYVKALVFNSDTLHLFVNHWPSRYGGLMKTEPKRNFVAKVLRKQIDSIVAVTQDPNILIMGDFNDSPEDKSINEILKVSYLTDDFKSSDLVNLLYKKNRGNLSGSLKYREKWNAFDQIIVTACLLDDYSSLKISENGFGIFSAEFLLVKDDKYIGKKPFRTYSGYKYLGGFSDHLPIYIDLIKEK